MDGDRKYKQRGYQEESGRSASGGGFPHDDRARGPQARLPIDITGPRLPRLVQNLVASRCFNCTTVLPSGTNFKGQCPKCGASLHCCKQCVNFDSSTRFQCLKPIPVRIPLKDQANSCDLFSPRVTVARDATIGAGAAPSNQAGRANGLQAPRNANDARAAFDSLFKK